MELFLYMAIAVLLGACAIILVSGEVSYISGISKSGRYILAFFLSFGVLGFSVKTIAIGLLQQNSVMETAVTISQGTVQYDRNANVAPRGLTYPIRGKAWRALPELNRHVNAQKVELGKYLFFDKRLSSTKTVACASCHDIAKGGDDGLAVSHGVDGLQGGRNAPTVLNAVYMRKFFWDGRAKSLADQARGPLLNPVEMAMHSFEDVVKVVSNDQHYIDLYQTAYKGPVSIEGIVDAIAAFEETLVSNDAPYDRFVAGDQTALSHDQMNGLMLFDELGCRRCHMDPTFSVAGIKHKSPFMRFPIFDTSPYIEKYSLHIDRGRNNRGLWRVPSLRNVEHTAPYLHNGAVPSLEEAVRVMVSAQLGLKITDHKESDFITSYTPQGPVVARTERDVSSKEIKQIVAFLKALSGSPLHVEDPWEPKKNNLMYPQLHSRAVETLIP